MHQKQITKIKEIYNETKEVNIESLLIPEFANIDLKIDKNNVTDNVLISMSFYSKLLEKLKTKNEEEDNQNCHFKSIKSTEVTSPSKQDVQINKKI